MAVFSICFLNRHIKKRHLQREILQDQDVKEYLINKLNVDEELLKKALIRWPTILRVNVRKINQLIDLLQQNGIMGDEILRHPRVFYFNTETLHKRIEMLKEAGLPPKVSLIIYSQKDLDKYVKHKLQKL